MQVELQHLDLRYAGLVARRSREEAQAVASVSQGVQAPSPVVAVAEGPSWVVVTGFEHVGALKRLGEEIVEITVWALTAPEALALRERLRRGRQSALEEGWLTEELRNSEGWDEVQIARQMGRSRSWVAWRRELVRVLPASVQTRVRRGQLDGDVASGPLMVLARLSPRASERLAEALAGKDVTRKQVLELVSAYRRAAGEGRERLLREPLLYLKGRQEPESAVVKKARALLGYGPSHRPGDERGTGEDAGRGARALAEGQQHLGSVARGGRGCWSVD